MPGTWTSVADIAKQEMVSRLKIISGKDVRWLLQRLQSGQYGDLGEFIIPELLIKRIRARYPLLKPGKIARMMRRYFSNSDDIKPFFTGEKA